MRVVLQTTALRNIKVLEGSFGTMPETKEYVTVVLNQTTAVKACCLSCCLMFEFYG